MVVLNHRPPTKAARRPDRLGEATRGSAVVEAMTFDGVDSCPRRSAAAVAEQQGDETLRGGRTQLDVDGAVSGDRF
jgi:hypothetical protein